jgi:hypothetical protein
MKAFPAYEYQQAHGQMMAVGGMDLRDYFAAKAMQSIITDGKLGKLLIHDDYIKKVSEMSYEYADSMMKARNDS